MIIIKIIIWFLIFFVIFSSAFILADKIVQFINRGDYLK
jgi:hypothetical protein